MTPLMLVGTGSDVGKSVLCTALCRIFLQDGYKPAPFKAQNMALNSYATPDGKEIGRAQAVQAEACSIDPHTDMNPLLLKPNSEHTTQVVLNGKPIGNRSAYDYFRKEGREELRKAVNDAFDRLAERYNPIVMEGAGTGGPLLEVGILLIPRTLSFQVEYVGRTVTVFVTFSEDRRREFWVVGGIGTVLCLQTQSAPFPSPSEAPS